MPRRSRATASCCAFKPIYFENALSEMNVLGDDNATAVYHPCAGLQLTSRGSAEGRVFPKCKDPVRHMASR